MTWIVAGISLLATALNIFGHVGCFWLWVITNIFWAISCFNHGLPAQACLHQVYAALAVVGIIRWTKHPPARGRRWQRKPPGAPDDAAH